MKSQAAIDSVSGERSIITAYLLLLPAETDVRSGDRVTVLTDERGIVEMNADSTPAVFGIKAVLPRRARAQRHITAQLERAGKT